MIGLAITLAVVIFTAVFVALFRRLSSRLDAEQCTSEWLDNFSTANYAPMQRLFDEKDFEFLAGQPGYRPATARPGLIASPTIAAIPGRSRHDPMQSQPQP